MIADVARIVDTLAGNLSPGVRYDLARALSQREEEACDRLRLRAAVEGLMPSIVALALIECGLGMRPPEQEIEMLARQSVVERAAIAEAMRRFFEDGGG